MGPTIFFATEHTEEHKVFFCSYLGGLCELCGQTFLLLHTDCLRGTGVDANTAIDAGVNINNSFVISHTYGLAGALFYTGFATGAFSLVNFSRHLCNPFNEKPRFTPLEKIYPS